MKARAPKDLPARVTLFALRCYQTYFSILFGGTCRFEPTCSQYAYEAIERFGVLRGTWLGTKRLLRCHPLSRKFGYDPVPERLEATNLNERSAVERSTTALRPSRSVSAKQPIQNEVRT